MTYILGSGHDVVLHDGLRIWARDGLIHVEDSRDNSFSTHSVREMLLRVAAINDMLGRPVHGTESRAERKAMMEEREKLQRLVEQMIEVIRKAREQGTPDDPTARNSRVAALKKTFVMPAVNTIEGF